ncbi:zinc-binding dehydrogenase, partial [Candidatus Hydrogenedentota bacterium]
MKALVLKDKRQFEMTDIPEPQAGPGEARIAVKTVGLCGTDVHIYDGQFSHRLKYPTVIGHEFAGVVDQIGEGVTHLGLGQRVVADPTLPCGTCAWCQRGELNYCPDVKVIGVDRDGAMAEKIVVPAHKVHALPESVSFVHGPLAELYSVACRAVTRAQVEPGDVVVVLG